MHRALSIFQYTEAPHGNELPPFVNGKSLLMLIATPIVVVTALALGHQPLAIWWCLLTGSALYDSLTARQRFAEGMLAGRDEMTEEMWDAWTRFNMDPGDFLLRETWFGGEEDGAARQVRRPARSRTHP